MSTVTLDRLLVGLVAAQLATGLLTLRAGTESSAVLFIAHGLLGGMLLVAAILKVRRSLPRAIRARRWGRIAGSLAVALLVAAALTGGFAWVASGRILSIGPWTVLTLHVWAALALVPVLVLHLLPHRWRVVRAPSSGGLSRRAFLATGLLAVAGTAAWLAAGAIEAIQGGARRFTGSRLLPEGGIPPVTTFFGEGTPSIDAASWRIRVRGRVRHELSIDLDELAALGETEMDPVLDCTSGWAMRTTWRGVPVATLLELASPVPAATHVVVRSVTGWSTDLSLAEASDALVATRVAGQPLPAGNGAPARLVVPTRRGLDWVKWVEEIVVG
jgi:DMSO/TMAO reductase YedYZ molybdopterin-dependent catalytic subunit